MKRLVVCVSGSGSNLQALLDAIRGGSLAAEIVLVVSNRAAAYGLARARDAGIPTLYFPLKPYSEAGRSRAEYDAEKVKILITQLAYLQSILAANLQNSVTTGQGAIDVSNIAVLLKLNPSLQMHIDNIAASAQSINPEQAELISQLEKTLRNIAVQQPQLPQDLLDAVKLSSQNQVNVDLGKFIQELAVITPQSVPQLNEIARQITQTFGDAVIQHPVLANVSPGAHVVSSEINTTIIPAEKIVSHSCLEKC